MHNIFFRIINAVGGGFYPISQKYLIEFLHNIIKCTAVYVKNDFKLSKTKTWLKVLEKMEINIKNN